MLTFSPLGGTAVQVNGSGPNMLVFPGPSALQSMKQGGLALLSVPEEEPLEGRISWPGEYDIDGVSIKGIGHLEGRQVSYVMEVDGMRIAMLSAPLQDWTDRELEMVGDIDVLLLPTDETKLVQKLVDEFDPRILLLVPTGGKEQQDVLKTMGATGAAVDEYKLKGQLPAEGREVVVLEK